MGKWSALAVIAAVLLAARGNALAGADATATAPADGAVVKQVLQALATGQNLLKADAWRPWQKGFQPQGQEMVCDNAADPTAQRGASQTVVLNQARADPIVATAWSKAEAVGAGGEQDYCLYLDLLYADGTPLWGQIDPFETGTHDWQQRQVIVFPAKPVKSLSFHLLLRRHTGKAFFRDARLSVLTPPAGAGVFDGVPVTMKAPPAEGFQVRDVAVGGDFLRIDRQALGLRLKCTKSQQKDATFFDVELTDTTGKDRAVTLVYAVPMPVPAWTPVAPVWFEGPRRTVLVEPGREYVTASSIRAGATGRLSRWPLGAVAGPRGGQALAIDMAAPALYRIGYNSASSELSLAYDLGLAPEKPSARVRFCHFEFDCRQGFRGALAQLYKVYGDAFRCRTPKQGLWMPFAKIDAVTGWEDFGFAFKEGNDQTAWDDEHGILTFRYTEPMTWWMKMPKDMPRTVEAATAEAKRLADKGDAHAKAFFTSTYENEQGRYPARFLDTPWCNGVVWSMNSMPGVAGEFTDFKAKWNPALREKLYGPQRRGDLDGEYIDSSECYVTDELDFRREHFAAAERPLTFSLRTRRVGVFTGLAVFEYARAIAADVHGMGKYMMANGTPGRLCWLAPLLEVMGTETDWNPGGTWRPEGDEEMLYRRAMCRGKPYCFLMNTDFDKLPSERVEKYMKRSLAYGMFPGFFSHNASEGQYFTRPALYNRDRPLFKKYVPLCRLVAEAGWEPITGAASGDAKVYVERFGRRYLTVFNDSPERRTVTLTLDGPAAAAARELVSGKAVAWQADGAGCKTALALEAEDVAVIDLAPDS
jgi:hypothetical protein